ncbi:MAG TPA: SDR family oxidoreductase [Vicinamibacterales bacterium]|nr:SDR family oxidoreductase [Vicinamibacterales bacterium]
MSEFGGLLAGKVALVFGAGGAVGGAVGTAFAAEGARTYLSGRRRESVARTAEASPKGSDVAVHEVDATDEAAVTAYVDGVHRAAGRIDVVFNAVGSTGHTRVVPSTILPLDAFMGYMSTMVRSQFLTARVAARHMLAARTGVVIFLGATPARGIVPQLAGPSTGHAAVEGMTRCLATEWGPHGIRVVAVRAGGMQETRNIGEVLGQFAALQGISVDAMRQMTNEKALLRRTPTLRETAAIATFLASDRASSITGAIINASCGEVVD